MILEVFTRNYILSICIIEFLKLKKMKDLIIFNSCLICKSKNISPRIKFQKAHLVKCQDCGFIFSQKKPTHEELKIYYNSYPVDSSISPITLTRYDELLRKLEQFRKTNNILDVGCGDGHFLEVAKKNNWNVFGTEFRKEAVECCLKKGIYTHHGPLSSLVQNPGYFDVITSFEVFEHINNPLEETDLFKKFLRPGGIAYVTTPNFNSLTRRILGNKWNVIVYPEHISYYTIATLKKLFLANNFGLINYAVTGFSVTRFLNSNSNIKRNNSPNHQDEKIRLATETNSLLKLTKKSINSILTITKTGDSIKAFFKKNNT